MRPVLFALLFILLASSALFWIVYSINPDEQGNPSILFSVIPADASESLPGVYPRGSRLYHVSWQAGKPVSEEVFSGLDLAGPTVLHWDGKRILFAARENSGSYQIWEGGSDGSSLRMLFATEAAALTPHYLPDGRIVFSLILASDSSASQPGTALYVSDLDGSDRVRITFDRGFHQILLVLRDGRILFTRRGPHREEVKALVIRPDGTEIEEYLASSSFQPGAVGPGVTHSDGQALFWSNSGEVQSREIFRREGFLIRDPLVVGAHTKPPVTTSLVDPELGYGWLLCLDASFSGFDSNRYGRVVRTVRIRDGRSEKILGQLEVKSDGSFYARVPADRLLRIETLDENGDLVGKQETGFWVRPNERRGCIGCHEPRNLVPENRLPQAVLEEAVVVHQPDARKGHLE